VAATEPELCGWDGLVCGVGPVEAAVVTARSLAARPPGSVLNVGIAGARRSSGLEPLQLVLGEVAVYEDLNQTTGLSPVEARPDEALLALARATLPDARVLAVGTTGRVGGSEMCPVEAMEGFAVLRAAMQARIPAVELRVISNVVEADRGSWRIDEALEALGGALERLVPAFRGAFG
jgi:futalosine hydrolase